MDVLDIPLLRWPEESDRRRELAADRVPRLLVVDPDASPPTALDCLEDWVRAGADEADVAARRAAVERRAAAHQAHVPEIDDHGVLRFGAALVPLPPVEGRLAVALVDRFGAVVSRQALTEAGWPGGAARNALDVHILRLRRRIHGAGLAIRTVRSRGYLLEPARRT